MAPPSRSRRACGSRAIGEQTYQLAIAPEVRKGALYVPLQLVAEIIPRVATNLAWDPERFELRAFSTGRSASRRARSHSAPRRSRHRARERSALPMSRASSAPRRSRRNPGDGSASRAPARRRRRGPWRTGRRHARPNRRRHGSPREEHHAQRRQARRRGAQQARHRRQVHAHDRHAHRPVRPRPHRQRRARGPVRQHSRERRESQAGRIPAARAASRRTSSPKPRPRTHAASSRWKTRS